jgi:ribonuclease HI
VASSYFRAARKVRTAIPKAHRADHTQPLFATEPAANLPAVTLTTDGGCVPNPGRGAWAAVLRSPGSSQVRELSGAAEQTTNNRMEMTAVIEGLRALTRRAAVTVRTDSMINIGLINGTGMKPSKRANQDLVLALLAEVRKHDCRAVWVKGHAGDADNERCDALCADLLGQARPG